MRCDLCKDVTAHRPLSASRHGCSHPQSSWYQVSRSRSGATAARTVARTDVSRRSVAGSAGKRWQSECKAWQPQRWTPSLCGWRCSAAVNAAATGSAGTGPHLAELCTDRRRYSARAACHAASGSAPRASTLFFVCRLKAGSEFDSETFSIPFLFEEWPCHQSEFQKTVFFTFSLIVISFSKTNQKKKKHPTKISLHLRRHMAAVW